MSDERWRKALERGGFRVVTEPWSPYVPERPTQPAPFDPIGAAVRKAVAR